ncbi:MAG: hypothetical protein GWN84_05245 [Gammaproteobacteria bacterium]|nr:hypothetical protein [Gammaproteobacteria bacterium]NIR82367.1 hypothetical protein [Gammaproteobacteria bacterium]NIU03512.1 hypothetical protein [Gammaproteobacteria bacterium]NIX84786.1 hypothetical protein [Gammaproteobacteria bacterium]
MQSTDRYERFIALAETLESAEIKTPPAWEGERCSDGCPGWGVFDIGARPPGVEVERCDCCDRFATDEEAEDYVLRLTIAPECGDAACLHCRRRAAGVAEPDEPACAAEVAS